MHEILLGLAVLLAAAAFRVMWPGLVGLGLILYGSTDALLTQRAEQLDLPWSMPGGALALSLDPLSAYFLAPSALLGMLALIYARGYFHGKPAPWFFLHLMLGSLAFVLICRTPIAFLIGWEVMALASFFLVTVESESREVRRAGWIYLLATHLGTFFLMGAFLATDPNLVFVLALIGFGSKAGFVPLHVWLPEAHPVAPSPVSALMSGVLINMGLYGVMRTLDNLGPAPAWWGWTVLTVGAVTAVTGVLWALAQRNLKQLLAYSSVENMGLVAIGLGLGMLGQPLGTQAAMLHVLSHSLLKALCFMGAGAVLHQAHTCDVERLGGLLKRMPVTGAAFLVGAAGLAGVPPLNGFVTEFLLLKASLESHNFLALVALALTAGLSLAAFSKAFGIVFLGEARSARAEQATDPGRAMLVPMVTLALLVPLPILPVLVEQRLLAPFAALIGIALALFGARHFLLQGRSVRREPTWDCGYRAPTPRMEYTGLSFTQPLTELFALRHQVRREPVVGVFPTRTSFSDTTPDLFEEEVYKPMLEGLQRLSQGLRRIQHGRVQAYILYILVTLMGLLAWGLA